jgi:hypothetical protein
MSPMQIGLLAAPRESIAVRPLSVFWGMDMASGVPSVFTAFAVRSLSKVLAGADLLRGVAGLEITLDLAVDVLGTGLSFRAADAAGGLREVCFVRTMLSERIDGASGWFGVSGCV